MYDFSWRFLQDWNEEYEEKLMIEGIVFIKQPHGHLIACDHGGRPIHWSELDDITPGEIFNGN